MLGLWKALSPRRRIIVAVATIGVFLGLVGLSRMAAAPEMALLYGGLDAREAGEVIQALDAASARYDVRGNAIYVDAARRDALRMQLAADGMLAGSGAGYEILDGLSGFGTTSQMFDAAYWRAKEGELARTILAGPGIRQVRVHIAQPPSGSFRRNTDVTASVTVTASAGSLTGSRAEAFRFLVASAVPGLTPDRVTIVDAVSGRLIGEDHDAGGLGAGTLAQEESLQKAVERLLAARFGPENAIVEVSISPVTDAETIRERRIDPQSRVAISTNIEEITASERNTGGDAVTVASNLPDGDAAEGASGSQSQNAETRTVTNFEISEVIRDIERLPGAVKRLTVAVLVNRRAIGMEPEAIDAELGDVRELVAASVGFDEARGDRITVKALAFEPASDPGTEAGGQRFADLLAENPMRLIQFAVLALVTIILAVFVIRPILASRRPEPDVQALDRALEPAAGAPALPRSEPIEAIGPDRQPASIPAASPDVMALPSAQTVPDGTPAKPGHDPVTRLKTMIETRQPDTIAILRNWLEDETVGGKT
jgi:flagellar M-ring protein FliF